MFIQGLTGGMVVRGSRLSSWELRSEGAVSQGLQNNTTNGWSHGLSTFADVARKDARRGPSNRSSPFGVGGGGGGHHRLAPSHHFPPGKIPSSGHITTT
jgi:hypothetical protein